MGERLHEPQLSDLPVERTQVVALEVDVQIPVDQAEAVGLVPALDVRVVAGPGLEPDEPAASRPVLGLFEQRSRDPPPLVVGVDGEVPDHPAVPRPVGEDAWLELYSRSSRPTISPPSSATSSIAGRA